MPTPQESTSGVSHSRGAAVWCAIWVLPAGWRQRGGLVQGSFGVLGFNPATYKCSGRFPVIPAGFLEVVLIGDWGGVQEGLVFYTPKPDVRRGICFDRTKRNKRSSRQASKQESRPPTGLQCIQQGTGIPEPRTTKAYVKASRMFVMCHQ